MKNFLKYLRNVGIIIGGVILLFLAANLLSKIPVLEVLKNGFWYIIGTAAFMLLVHLIGDLLGDKLSKKDTKTKKTTEKKSRHREADDDEF